MEKLFRRAALACWTSILVLVIVVASSGHPAGHAVAGKLALVDRGSDLSIERAAAIQVATPEAAPVAPVAGDSGPPPPGRLRIPRIGVNAQVLGVGLAKDGSMAVTNESYTVGWYNRGTAPGNTGDAVIVGHLDWYDTSHAVFFNLKDLRPGDDIEVQRLDGVTKHFRVISTRTVAYNASVPGLFAGDGAPRLSLITCGGAWDKRLGQYLQRVIVDASLVS
ncbi:MAG TPA: class F sortase [Candidatus Dormibacteraeota bacterium]|nr:class F sortase [Candidatus Dormibacteraeota bacterium]